MPNPPRRTHCVSVRLSDGELARLNTHRGRRSRGAYLRAAWLANLPPVVPAVNLDCWRELSRSASNLNQLAHLAHIGQDPELAAARAALSTFRAALLGAKR